MAWLAPRGRHQDFICLIQEVHRHLHIRNGRLPNRDMQLLHSLQQPSHILDRIQMYQLDPKWTKKAYTAYCKYNLPDADSTT